MKIIIVLSMVTALFAQTPWEKLTGFDYENQFEKRVELSDDTAWVVMSFEKETAAMVNGWLSKKPTLFLHNHHAVHIADISAMPSIITALFALPKLQKFKHPIYLVRDETFAQAFVPREGMVTVLSIQNGRVLRSQYVNTMNDLEMILASIQ